MILLLWACDFHFPSKEACEDTAASLTYATAPDFTTELPADAQERGLAGDWWEEGKQYQVEAWDCVDVSWWNPAGEQKVVQVVVLDDSCAGGHIVDFETYDCNSHEGWDAPWRDWDGDGISSYNGDCDDEDATVGAC